MERRISAGLAARIPLALRPLVRTLPFVVGIGLIALVAWVNAFPTNRVFLDGAITTQAQIVLWFAAMGLVAWGIAGSPAAWRWTRIDPREALIVLALFIAALLTRFIGLDSTLRLLPDESNFVTSANTVLADDNLLLFFPMSDVGPFPWLFATLQGETVDVLGRTLTGLRGAAALYGAAGIVTLYLLARLLFDRRTAILAALVLITLPPHLHFSRMTASLTIADAWIAVLFLAGLIWALKSNTRLAWGTAGVLLGFTQVYSDANKLLIVPFTVILLLWLTVVHGESRRAIRAGIVRFIIAAAIVALPVYTTLIAHDRPLFGRVAGNSAIAFWEERFRDGLNERDVSEFVDRLTAPFRFIGWEPEREAVYYGGVEPLVMRAFVPLLIVGAIASLTRWRSPAILPLALVLTFTTSNALFIRDPASSPRYVGALPMLALLIGLGLAAVYGGIVRLRRGRYGLARGVTTVLALVIVLVQLDHYFNTHLPAFRLQHRRHLTYADTWDATLRMNALLPRNTQGIYIGRPAAPGQESSMLLGFLQSGNLHPFLNYEAGEITPALLRSLARDRGLAFFVETRHTEVIALLYREFPQAASPRYPREDMEPREQYLLIYVPEAG